MKAPIHTLADDIAEMINDDRLEDALKEWERVTKDLKMFECAALRNEIRRRTVDQRLLTPT